MFNNKLTELSFSIYTIAAAPPQLAKLIALLGEVKGWVLALVGAITVVMIAIQGVNYQHGDGQDKAESVKNIKKILAMGGGIFFLVWFGAYVVTKMT